MSNKSVKMRRKTGVRLERMMNSIKDALVKWRAGDRSDTQ